MNRIDRFVAVFSALDREHFVPKPQEKWAFTRYLKGSTSNLTVFGSQQEMLAESEDQKIMLLLYGQVYDKSSADCKPNLIKEYHRLGPNFIRSVNGSFALLIVDRERDLMLVFTDRVNSRKVFFSNLNGNLVLSSQLSDQPLRLTSLDTTAAACYLANGSMLNNRTLYQGIRTLERASIHHIENQKLSSNPYWNYEFNQAYENVPVKKLQSDFGDVLISAVRLRVQDENLISLSSGYDSSFILGVMGSVLHLPNVHTFSYKHGIIKSNSDEAVAGQMSSVYGYPHSLIPSFDGNLIDTLERNGSMGEGISNFCDEVDAWIHLKTTYANHSPALFVGDECFGGYRVDDIKSVQDVLKFASIYSFESQAWLRNLFGKTLYDQLCLETASEIEILLSRAASFIDLRDMKDYLFLDHRTNHRVMPWRDNFAGRFFHVQNPFLDNEVLDFMMAVPRELRRGKRLFRETAVRMFPELFQFERARLASSANYWPGELRLQHQDLDNYIYTSDASLLDQMIPRETIQKVMQVVIARIPSPQNRNLQNSIIKGFRKAFGKTYKGAFPTSDEAVQSLKRILLLRQFLIDK